jgi:hypothetical protein
LERIEGNDLPRVLREHLSLIVGPAFTSAGDFTESIIAALQDRWGALSGHGLLELTDQVLRNGVTDEQLRSAISEHLGSREASPLLAFLVKLKYRAVLSSAPDRFFEQALQAEYAPQSGMTIWLSYPPLNPRRMCV